MGWCTAHVITAKYKEINSFNLTDCFPFSGWSLFINWYCQLGLFVLNSTTGKERKGRKCGWRWKLFFIFNYFRTWKWESSIPWDKYFVWKYNLILTFNLHSNVILLFTGPFLHLTGFKISEIIWMKMVKVIVKWSWNVDIDRT